MNWTSGRRRASRVFVAMTTTILTGSMLLGGSAGAAEDGQEQTARSSVSAEQRFATEPMPLIELYSPHGPGRLYTTDLPEARRASAGGMTQETGEVGYLPKSEVDGSRALHRLKERSSSTAWLLASSEEERRRLVDDGWIDEGIIGYVYEQPADGRVKLFRFFNGDEWRVADETHKEDLLAAGYSLDGLLGYVYDTWIRAGAAYFPMWHEGGHTKEAGCEYYYGRRDVWCGIRDFYDGHPYSRIWPGNDFKYLKPSMGYYDDSDPRTWERHIDVARSAGLSFFSMYWYWDSEERREYSSDVGLAAFLAADNSMDMDFTVAVCAHKHKPRDIPADHFDDVARTLVDKYLSQPNTLRTNDGRKILSICDAQALGDGENGDVAAFVRAVRSQARDRLDEEIYVSFSHPALHASEVSAVGGDGAYCTTDSAAVKNQSYADYLRGQRDFFRQSPADQEFIRCALSGFDERTRYPVQKRELDEIRYFRDYRPRLFWRAVQNLRDDLDQSVRPPNVDNLAIFFAWNEWDEGGVIEPNVRDGCFYLDTIREGLSLTDGSGCVEQHDLRPSISGRHGGTD